MILRTANVSGLIENLGNVWGKDVLRSRSCLGLFLHDQQEKCLFTDSFEVKERESQGG